MRITLQITCDDAAEAQKIIGKLTRPDTWVDMTDKTTAMNARVDKIMGSTDPVGEQSLGNSSGSEGAPRPNVSPGEPSIGKIGADSKAFIHGELKAALGTGRVPEHFGTKFQEHLKLLWKRGEIKWDGTEYYL